MPAVSHRHELVYFPIPKNATTSVKLMFYALDAGHPYDEATASRLGGPVHRLYSSEPGEWLDYYAAYTSLVIVRDPVKRVLSAYANRVLMEKVGPGRAKSLKRAGLSVKPTLDEFLAKFHRYRKVSKIIRNHTIPQVEYVGGCWDKLSVKLPIERLAELPKNPGADNEYIVRVADNEDDGKIDNTRQYFAETLRQAHQVLSPRL
ncbi:MAG: sulfotransferase family protein [Hyphomicrobiales bacterium]|nr:sulfotransferase family protein [Hyphomicrobiales bacterium]